jgi:hypothetical protein
LGTKTGTRTALVLFVALVAAAAFAVAGRADDPRFDQVQSSLGPSFVDAGQDVLVTAQWHYIDNQTLTHGSVEFTIPDGWTLVSSDPSVCTQLGTSVTCPKGTITQGALIKQAVELRTDADLGSAIVTSDLVFYEGPRNPGRRNHVFAPDGTTNVISADEPNRTGKCVDKNGGTISTEPGVGGSSTSAVVPETDDLCSPVSISERTRQNPTEGCLIGLQCVAEIVTTDAPLFPAADPIQLTLTFFGTGLNNRPLIFNGGQPDEQEVEQCTAPGATPDPCFFDSVNRRRSVTWSVNWSGRDPGWTV